MNLDALLSRLHGLHPTGADRWQARCPAHPDKSPSLSVALVDDRILLFCHAGCEVADILRALGLGWGDICPDRKIAYAQAEAASHRRQRRRLADISAMDYSKLVLKIAAADLAAGYRHDLADRATIEIAREVMRDAR